MLIVLSSCLEIKYTRCVTNVLNQNGDVAKRASFATFAVSIVDNLCLLQRYE